MKLCRGPLHSGGVLLPREDFHIYQSGPQKGHIKPFCRACNLEKSRLAYQQKTGGGLIPVRKLLPFMIELVQRIGLVETCRRTGLGTTTVSEILRQKHKYTRKATFQKVAIVLMECRKADERRHRFSIHHGASQRQRPERIPKAKRDLHVIKVPEPEWD